ncbi:MDR family MFS transporter [Lacisediminihabitans profunda]|uniref:Multidrug efflux MFS transporter n=1 Tax=Lacisediminihabitans profunda TaxID=2594790 RepID=A0A5C8URN4_9MICO|nr:MDR family MFS transporter [Lacisediminihabitans profunda]TXN31234.1 multidrug efflux MFS transporter [Lacisediminihabitans profunda]
MSTAPTKEKVDPKVMRVAMVLIVGGLAVVFDTTIVSVALHTLAIQLHSSVATIQWVSTGYLLALGVTIPLVSWAQNRFGGKLLWMFALMVFLAGSIGSSLAWSAPSLIGFRIVQGVGGGLMLPLMTTLVMQAAAGKSLGRTMSVVSLPAVLGPILGPVLGGVILNWLDWRWLFYVNIPFCVVGFLLAWKMLPTDPRMAQRPLDVLGFIALSPGIVGILYGLSNASNTNGFARPDVYGPLLAGAALLLTFVIHALRRGDSALVDIRLFTHRAVASASALLFLSGAALYGAMLLLPLYFQQVRGVDALGAGLLLVPQGIGTFFSRSLAGRLTDTLGAKWVTLIGFAIVGVATVPFAFATASTNDWILMAALLVRGFGLGAVTIPLMTAAFVGLDRSDVAHASIITRIAQQVGGSFGVALLAVILDGALAHVAASTRSVSSAFDEAFWWSIGFTFMAVVLSFALPGRARIRTTRRPVTAVR